MSLLRTAIKTGIAKKIYDEARKPHNQRKIKEFVSSVTSSRKGTGTGRGGDPGRPTGR